MLKDLDDFADVTLACKDGVEVEVHKVVLSATCYFVSNNANLVRGEAVGAG